MAKIKEEQLKTIQEQQAKLQNILTEVGLVEVRKHELLHAQAVVAKEVEETKKELEEEYGSVNINTADGTYTKIEETDDSELSVVKSED